MAGACVSCNSAKGVKSLLEFLLSRCTDSPCHVLESANQQEEVMRP